MVDFLLYESDTDFQKDILSYADDIIVYEGTVFQNFIHHLMSLLNALATARKLVFHRLKRRQCSCPLPHDQSFVDIVKTHFHTMTLYDYLSQGDAMECDKFKADICTHVSSLHVESVLTAYHNVRKFLEKFVEVRDSVVHNPFAWL